MMKGEENNSTSLATASLARSVLNICIIILAALNLTQVIMIDGESFYSFTFFMLKLLFKLLSTDSAGCVGHIHAFIV